MNYYLYKKLLKKNILNDLKKFYILCISNSRKNIKPLSNKKILKNHVFKI